MTTYTGTRAAQGDQPAFGEQAQEQAASTADQLAFGEERRATKRRSTRQSNAHISVSDMWGGARVPVPSSKITSSRMV